MILASINEEVSRHVSPFSNSFEALKFLKELYDSHTELEFIQLMIKLFSLELKSDDPLSLTSEVRSIMHDIKSCGVEIYIPLISYVKEHIPLFTLS